MTRVPLQLWAEVSEDGKRCAKTCRRWLSTPPDGDSEYHSGAWCEEFGALDGERSPDCIEAEQAARDVPPSDGGARQLDEHERVTPEDVARITAMYERACGENERLREQMDAMAQRYNVVLDKEHALVMSLHAENARLREREARVRALCEANYATRRVLAILDDGKDGET